MALSHHGSLGKWRRVLAVHGSGAKITSIMHLGQKVLPAPPGLGILLAAEVGMAPNLGTTPGTWRGFGAV
ncbi:hypothetical protein IAQ61_011800 [Plenodomus lingam]|uniref:uncharacterized protein n=1 Tax=Leptosphaeria maculans TaxID=5022 RepID=UPI003324B531|nr:hypothetical protein IAQ61_011800 [Plenodomus lingam]